MKNQIWIFILFLGFLFSCDQQENTPYKIGFSQCVSSDAWRRAMHEEMKRELSFYPNLDLQIKDARGNNEEQIKQIQEFLDQGIDLLIVSPNESEPITPIVEKVFESGIPVVVVDRRITSNLYSAYVGGNNYEVGLTAGQYIKNLLKEKGKILEIWGLRGSSPAIERHRGLSDALQGTQIKIVNQINGEWEKDTAKNRLKHFLLKEEPPEFDLVFGHNDVMTIGAHEVCKNLSLLPKKFIGVDALPGPFGGIQAVHDGVLDATFFYPTGGDKAIEIAQKILTGGPYQKENTLQTAAVDSSNIRIMKQQTDKIIAQQDDIARQKERIEVQMEIYQNQRIFLFGFGLTLFVAILSLAYVFKSLRDKQEINEELQEKNKQILDQKDQVLHLSKKAEKATQQKFEFFTNISHEFRTPLTLIQAPVDELLQSKEASPFKNDLLLIRRNTVRLLRLVNQLMDFRKLDHGKMKVKAVEQEIIPFLEDILSAFQKTAKDHQINLKLLAEDRVIRLWFDPMMLDKVMFNLLSNAFKFTPDKGSILVKVEEDKLHNQVKILVEDTGSGMSPEQVKHIFDRFYQGEPNTQIGTGLGLSLSRELIRLHHGKLLVNSEIWKGTQFEIQLQQGKSHFDKKELVMHPQYQYFPTEQFTFYDDHENLEEKEITKDTPPKPQTVLIIEDEKEIREYLAKKLSKHYNILEAESAEIGVSKAMDQVPDLITCDLMLQNKDGFQIIQSLKSDLRTSHIPIIVITAISSLEERIKGIKLGVDDYITKPFSYSLVLERIKMLLASRHKLREHYIHELPIEKNGASTTPPDKKFISDFTSIVEQNIGNPQFGVNDICVTIGLSRGQLYRKVKALLGYSINDYISKVRLKKAKHLLLTEDSPISDIAFQVGYTTSAYFSTSFKNHFGSTPSEFRETHQEK